MGRGPKKNVTTEDIEEALVGMSFHPVTVLETLGWLISEDFRGKGRTRTLAISFLLEAVRHPDRSIPTFDHTRVKGNWTPITREIQILLNHLGRLGTTFILTRRSITFLPIGRKARKRRKRDEPKNGSYDERKQDTDSEYESFKSSGEQKVSKHKRRRSVSSKK